VGIRKSSGIITVSPLKIHAPWSTEVGGWIIDSSEDILILSGGLTYHNLGDFAGFAEQTAQPNHKAFHNAIISALQVEEVRSDEVVRARLFTLTHNISRRLVNKPCTI
jgi:aromatic ring-opening dioxygenase catalytic subunit (LigB family)